MIDRFKRATRIFSQKLPAALFSIYLCGSSRSSRRRDLFFLFLIFWRINLILCYDRCQSLPAGRGADRRAGPGGTFANYNQIIQLIWFQLGTASLEAEGRKRRLWRLFIVWTWGREAVFLSLLALCYCHSSCHWEPHISKAVRPDPLLLSQQSKFVDMSLTHSVMDVVTLCCKGVTQMYDKPRTISATATKQNSPLKSDRCN